MKRFETTKKIIASSAAIAMIATLIPQSVLVAFAEDAVGSTEKGLVLQYDFKSLQSGTIVNDLSGNGNAGVVRPTGSEVRTEPAQILGEEYTSYVMNGGQPDATHTYIELPQGILNGLEDTTISCWVYFDNANSGYQRIWDFGSDTTSYMYLLANGYNSGHTGYTAALTKSGWSNEKGPEKKSALRTGEWVLTTVTFDGSEKELSLYEDGQLIGTEKTDADLSALAGSTQNWIGYGQFKNDIFSGKIADFKIYNYEMSEDEVAATYNISDEDRVARDKNSLLLGDVSAVTEDLNLPGRGSAGSAITWSSSNENVITKEGKVTRPAAEEGDAQIKLTATITSGNVSDTKEFQVTVKKNLTAKEIVALDLEEMDLGNLSAVSEDLVLPTSGSHGATIIWESSDETLVTKEGKVTRPVGDAKTVELTATVSYGEEKQTKKFEVTLEPLYEKNEIVIVDEVSVTTEAGVLPTLPAKVGVTYEDDTRGSEKVVWPTDLKKEAFSEEGEVKIEGTIVDSDLKVTAKVMVTKEAVKAPEKEGTTFDLNDVSLDGEDTIYAQNKDRTMEYLKIMDADRMLYAFRATFGQDTKGVEPLTGWDEPTGLLRGHSTGHYLSALAQAYASSGDEAYKTKLDYMVHELRELQKLSKGNAQDFKTACTPTSASQSKWSTDPSSWGEGFLSAYSPDQFALLEQYTPYATIWAPYYTLHKILAGFIDCYNYAGNEEALEAAEGIGSWVYERLSNCTTEEQRTKMWAMYIAGEYGGMNESLARLYEITGEKKYLEAAQMFDNKTFFDGLASNEDTIQNIHANQHIPQIIGAMHEYAATGDSKYYNIAKNFWDLVVSRYAYSIGGVGTGERFKDPYKQGANILGNSGRGENCETCAAYNMLKLTMELYNYNLDDATYMDYYERTLINQIVASQNHNVTAHSHNGVTYMLPVDPGQRKGFDSDYGGFTCCNGTGMENHVKYQAAAYSHSGDNLYVNLYMPTTLSWEEKGVTIKQETKFPSEYSQITVNGSGTFTMKLRVPYWATKGFTVKVNGETVVENPEVSTYVEINRTWNDGDVVTIDMPYTLHLDKTPDKVDGDTVASVMYGPIVMVAKDTRSTYIPMNWYKLVLSDNLEESITVVNGTDSDEVPHLSANGIDFYPMYDADDYRYHAYVKLEENVPVVNKDRLVQLVTDTMNEELQEEDYDPELWAAYQTALGDAKAMIALEDATQVDVYMAYLKLKTALANMIPEKPAVDKTELKEAIDKCNSLTKSDYSEEDWTVFENVLEQVQIVYENENATEEEIANAIADLDDAYKVLTYRTQLRQIIAEYDKLDKSEYTEESWKVFQSALDSGKEVQDNSSATQTEIAEAISRLSDAYGKLEKKEENPGGQENPGGEQNNPGGGQGSKGEQNNQGGQKNNGQNGNNGNGNATQTATTTNTGDASHVMSWIFCTIGAMLCGGIAFALKFRRKRR